MILHRHAVLNPTHIEATLRQGQSDSAIFLSGRSAGRTVAEHLSALANADGGLLILGVTAKGGVQKEADPDLMAETAAQAGLLTDPPLILPSAQVVTLADDAPVVVVQVPPGLPHVYNVQGRYLTRSGDQNRALSTAELRRLLLERSETGFEVRPVDGAALTDLAPKSVEEYLDRIAAAPNLDATQILQGKGCLTLGADPETKDQWVPTIAGLLLFGKEPQRFLRSAELICVRYAGESMSDEFERRELGGSLMEQARQAEAFVQGNMRRGMRIAGLAREETTEYPLAVVREAIVNAIAHRDYSVRGEGIRLLMFSDRLQIYSPGRLPGHVTLANLVDERYSRNEAIVAVLTDFGYIERLGYGIDRMMAAMSAAGLPEPVFEETAAGFQVTLFSAGTALVSHHPEEQPWAHGFLNERQERALAFVQTHGRIANSDYQTLAPDVSPETIRRDLADLVEKNLLLKIGAKRATYYILK